MSREGLSYEQLETAFKHRNFKPLYFLFGDEDFLIQGIERLLVENALAPHEKDFNLDVVQGAETDTQKVLGLCAGFPMMAERRVVVVRDFDKLKDNRLFVHYVEKPNPSSVVLLMCSSKPNLSAHPYRALKEGAAWAEFKPLYERQIPGWIQERVRGKGYAIDPRAVQMLAEYVGTSLTAVEGEIEKLLTYAGERRDITADDVIRASGQTREFNVFELQRMIGERKYVEAMRITERLLQQASAAKSEALSIVAILTMFFTRLWKLSICQIRNLSDKEMAERIGVSPYFVKEYTASLERFGRRRVQDAFVALLAADFELKGGANRDERLVLALLMRRLTGSAPGPAARS